MARIVLANAPWYVFENGEHKHGVRAGCRWPSLGPGGGPHLAQMRGNVYMPYPFIMGYTSSLLEKHGHDVMYYDAIADMDTISIFYMKIDAFNPDIIILETATASIDTDLRYAEYLHNAGYKIALVGPHATVYADDLIKLPHVTYILKQEYDDLALHIANNPDDKGIHSGALPDNLDDRPFPHLEPPTAYYYNDYFGFGQYKRPQVQIWTTRGCLYNCNFCLWRHTMYDDKGRGIYRQRSAQNVLDEVDDRVERLGFKHVLFDDDTFSIVGREGKGSRGYDRVIGICDGMRERGVEWSFMTRVDCHSTDLFKYMVDSGAVACKVGIESFIDRTLKGITKNLTGDQEIGVVEDLVDMGLSVYLATMTYIPGETEDERQETTQILNYLGSLGVKWQRPHCTPIPGTPLFDIFKAEGYDLESDFSLFDGGAGKLHNIVEDYNKRHGAGEFDTGRHEHPHYKGQSGLKGTVDETV